LAKERRGKMVLEGVKYRYFHSIANGWRRKCKIDFLDTEKGGYLNKRI
jgi:hypothetical protein